LTAETQACFFKIGEINYQASFSRLSNFFLKYRKGFFLPSLFPITGYAIYLILNVTGAKLI